MNKAFTTQGDAGQVVGGDVIEAPRTAAVATGNVMNIRVGPEAAPEKCITDLQRKAILDKVDRVCSATGLIRLEVYGRVFVEFGLERIVELPRSQFRPVMDLLDRWLMEQEEAAAMPGDAADDVTALPDAADGAPQAAGPMTELGGAYRRELQALGGEVTRLRRRITWMALLTALAAFGGVFVAFQTRAAAPTPAPPPCLYNGVQYSIGSLMQISGVALACDLQEGAATWSKQEPPRRR